ncbi:MAG TPA: transcriptional regulator [candidate division Zixibacteria bacterium]|jgi:Rrf2 family transcriptional regulator, iron-sulfur cluster assembly transcription factor|nr:transcriptional regulator [candidate division Zixibacteria bacterium]
MKISAIEEYGIRCMLLLARRNADETLTLPEFELREGLSIPYAAKLLMILKRAGLVKAARGRKGGYMLARAPEQIPLKEILDALGEPVFSSSHCGRHSGQLDICVHHDDCQVRVIWKSFDNFISQILTGITLADVASGNLDFLQNAQITTGNGKENNISLER